MTVGLTDSQYYQDIADAIREKLGVLTTYTPSQMAAAIETITGGGGSCSHSVEFVDFSMYNQVSSRDMDNTHVISGDGELLITGYVRNDNFAIYKNGVELSIYTVPQQYEYELGPTAVPVEAGDEVRVLSSGSGRTFIYVAAVLLEPGGGGGTPSGFTYYNGVLLPTIPTVSGYDYVWIRRNDSTNNYDAIYGTDVWHTYTPDSPTLDNFRLYYDNGGTNLPKVCSIPFASASSGAWGEITTSSGGSFGTNGREVLWSSHDMKVGSSSGEILLAGGYPVTQTERQSTSLVEAEYQGYSYGYLGSQNDAVEFYRYPSASCYINLYAVEAGHKYILVVQSPDNNMGRKRCGFFAGKSYSDFSPYINSGGTQEAVINDGVLIVFDDQNAKYNAPVMYTAPSNGIIAYQTNSTNAEYPSYCVDLGTA